MSRLNKFIVVPSKREEAEECYLAYVTGLMNETEQAELQRKLQDDAAFAEAWYMFAAEADELQLDDVLAALDVDKKLRASKEQSAAKAHRRRVQSIVVLASLAALLFVIFQFYNPFKTLPSQVDRSELVAHHHDLAQPEVTFQATDGEAWVLDEKKEYQKDGDSPPMVLSTFMEQHDLAKSPQKHYTVRTPVVKDYKLQLEDGTVVWLNMSTSIRFPATFQGSSERRVYLDGEAYFEVAHRADQPFTVVTREGEVRVKGTVFNLSSDPKEGMQAALVSGRVDVKNRENNTVSLLPGEEAFINSNGQVITRDFNEKDKLSWMRGTHYFYKIPFEKLNILLPKWYGVQVQFAADFPVGELISGVLHKNKLRSLLENIKETTGHHYRVDDGVVFFTK